MMCYCFHIFCFCCTEFQDWKASTNGFWVSVFAETQNPRIGTRFFLLPIHFVSMYSYFFYLCYNLFQEQTPTHISCASLFRDQHNSRSFNKEMSHSLYPCPWPYFLKLDIGVLNMSIFACNFFCWCFVATKNLWC
jgi:hypothetical protein